MSRDSKSFFNLAKAPWQPQRPPARNVVGDHRADLDLSQQWMTSSSQFLSTVFGPESEYYLRFKSTAKYAGYYSDLVNGMAIIRAAWNDYSKGYLFELRSLVRAEIFDDFLDLAQYLYDQGYHEPDAVLAGGVLEDSLRKLCDKNGILLPVKPKLDTMNADLAKKDVYKTLVQKRITLVARSSLGSPPAVGLT